MVAEGAAAAGALARHLTWSHYHRTLATLMRQLGRDPVREKPISLGLCSVLDAFHFNVVAPATVSISSSTATTASVSSGSGDAKQQQQAAAVSAAVASVVAASTTTDTTDTDAATAAEDDEEELDETSTEPTAPTSSDPIAGDGVWRALTVRIMPALRTLLTREEAAKGGGKKKVLRAPVALALLKLLLRLPQSLLDRELSPLLLSVCSGSRARTAVPVMQPVERLQPWRKTLGRVTCRLWRVTCALPCTLATSCTCAPSPCAQCCRAWQLATALL
jgi:U3 small nucleolar RNA-associated protein 20